MEMVPPRGIASRALTARFIRMCSSCPASAFTVETSAAVSARSESVSEQGVQHVFNAADQYSGSRLRLQHLLRLSQH